MHGQMRPQAKTGAAAGRRGRAAGKVWVCYTHLAGDCSPALFTAVYPVHTATGLLNKHNSTHLGAGQLFEIRTGEFQLLCS